LTVRRKRETPGIAGKGQNEWAVAIGEGPALKGWRLKPNKP